MRSLPRKVVLKHLQTREFYLVAQRFLRVHFEIP